MDKQIIEQIRFVLGEGRGRMQAAIGSQGDLDAECRQRGQEPTARGQEILARLDRGEQLGHEDFELIRDANEIHVKDVENQNGRHKEALALADWLDLMMEVSVDEAMKILEQWLDKSPDTPARVYRALQAIWEEATPDGAVNEAAFDGEGRCLRCGSRVSFADVTDTVVFVGDEAIETYEGDIMSRHCVRCTYPEYYPDYEYYDREDEKTAGIVGGRTAEVEIAAEGGGNDGEDQ